MYGAISHSTQTRFMFLTGHYVMKGKEIGPTQHM